MEAGAGIGFLAGYQQSHTFKPTAFQQSVYPMKTDARHLWAAEKLDVQPEESVLEIGCGYGITAALVASRLRSGKLTAIDRSEAMITKASIRNEAFIMQGKAAFYKATLRSSIFTPHLFDKIYAFNVSLFLKPSGAEFRQIASLLKPDGLLYVFYQPPFENTSAIKQAIRTAMEKNAFRIIETDIRQALPASIVCVVGAPEENVHLT